MNIGHTFRVMRVQADLRLKDIAEELGVTISYWSDVENGRRVERRMSRIVRVCSLCLLGDDIAHAFAKEIAEHLIASGVGVVVDDADWLGAP